MAKYVDKDGGAKAPARNMPVTLAGMVLLVLGVAAAFWSKGQQNVPDWYWYTAVGVAAAGGLTCWLSTLPREHAIEWVKSLVFALSLALVIRWSVAEPYRIPSGSMETTLHGDERFGRGDRVFVNKWVYGLRYPFTNKRIYYGAAPQRWDMVVFKTVEEGALHKTLVKRIVGMPGERIHIEGGIVYADGAPLDIPDALPEGQTYTSPFGRYYGVSTDDKYAVIPEGHYLVLGDNSGNSRDGRYFGWLPNDHIVGRVASIWWPPQRWRDFTGFTATLWWRTLLALLALWTVVRLFIGRSWAEAARDGKGVDHCFVSFVRLGLRIPFTRAWLRRWGAVRRGDLVLYYPDGAADFEGEALLGRVVGMPGEKVSFNGGTPHIDGAALERAAWLDGKDFSKHPDGAVYGVSGRKDRSIVPGGHYFVLSENASDENALDSRALGWVAEKNIAGKATLVWWPPQRIKRGSDAGETA